VLLLLAATGAAGGAASASASASHSGASFSSNVKLIPAPSEHMPVIVSIAFALRQLPSIKRCFMLSLSTMHNATCSATRLLIWLQLRFRVSSWVYFARWAIAEAMDLTASGSNSFSSKRRALRLVLLDVASISAGTTAPVNSLHPSARVSRHGAHSISAVSTVVQPVFVRPMSFR